MIIVSVGHTCTRIKKMVLILGIFEKERAVAGSSVGRAVRV